MIEAINADMIRKINHTAQENFDKAQGMLEMLNEVFGTRYGWLAKRVIRFENPDKGYSSPAHDLWAELDAEERKENY